MTNNFIETLKIFTKVTAGISASDILGWIFAVIGGIFIYNIIDNMQTSMARHSMIKEIEDNITNIFSSSIARRGVKEKIEKVFVRTVLDDEIPWNSFSNGGTKKTVVIIEEAQRYIQIRSGKEKDYISTQAIHEIMIWFRRVEKLYKSHIIKKIDLNDLWREILPLGASGRLEFYSTYFNEKDAQTIALVVMYTVLGCAKYKNRAALNYFVKWYKENKTMQELLKNNVRFRLIDYFRYYQFKKYISDYDYNKIK